MLQTMNDRANRALETPGAVNGEICDSRRHLFIFGSGLAAMFLFATGILSQTRTPTPSPGVPYSTMSPTPTAEDLARGRTILDRAADAMGGEGLIDRMRTLVIESTTHRMTVNGNVEFKEKTNIAFPFSFRQDTVFGGKTLSLILTSDGGYLVGPLGSTDMPEDQRRSAELTVFRNPVALLKTRRLANFRAWAYVPPTGGKPSEVIVEVPGDTSRLYVDPDGRIIALAFDAFGGEPQRRGTVKMHFSKYRKFKSLSYPTEIKGEFDGKPSFQGVVESCRYDGPIPPDTFSPTRH